MADPVLREQFDLQKWLDEIAARSKAHLDDVRAVLEKHGIHPKPSIAVPKRLLINSLSFSGEKRGASECAAINFQRDFDAGLWAITSTRNSRGKTTLLKLIRWCLTGHRSIDPIMKDWFDSIKLSFTFDGRLYDVQIDDPVNAHGSLLRRDDARTVTVHQFQSDEEFESVMSAFFMGELGLQGIVNRVAYGEKGVDHPHGWPWLSTAMTIDPDPVATFGSVAIGAMPTRMMQMFLGIPWVNTVNDIKAALARIKIDSDGEASSIARGKSQTEARISELETQLAARKDELAQLPDEDDVRSSLRSANASFAEAEDRHRKLIVVHSEAVKDEEAADDALVEARRAVRAFKDSRDAGFIFRSLKPTCCPSCNEVFTEQRELERSTAKLCLVCDTPEVVGDDSSAEEDNLKNTASLAEQVLAAQRRRTEAVMRDLAAASDAMRAADRECANLKARLIAPSPRGNLEKAIVRLEAQIEEVRRSTDSKADEPEWDGKVLQAAARVTEGAFKPIQTEVLKRVSELTRKYAVSFGVENLDSVAVDGGAHMALVIAGHKVAFGTRSGGERARLKIAATLAIIKVADEEGIGRHPGLLLIDSPGSNEMVTPDYEKVIDGFAELADELKHMQVFIASIDRPIIRERVSCDKIVNAEGDSFLW